MTYHRHLDATTGLEPGLGEARQRLTVWLRDGLADPRVRVVLTTAIARAV